MQPPPGSHNHQECVQTQLCAQLEFLQIVVVAVVMVVMVVVITCLLNRYGLSSRRSTHRPGADSRGSQPLTDPQVCPPQPPDRPHTQPFQSVYGTGHFQPTYPYSPWAAIQLPPTIALSDGEEPPPYAGPCTLQLRDPEQQGELNRESVRAPPNRTVFDSQLVSHGNCSHGSFQAPPPSVHADVSAQKAQRRSWVTYSQVIVRHFFHPSSLPLGNNRASGVPRTVVHGFLLGSTERCPGRSSNNNPHTPQDV